MLLIKFIIIFIIIIIIINIIIITIVIIIIIIIIVILNPKWQSRLKTWPWISANPLSDNRVQGYKYLVFCLSSILKLKTNFVQQYNSQQSNLKEK